MTMSTRPRPGDRPDIPEDCPHEGAVLILLYQERGRLWFPLTVRTTSVHAHKGQISLPGGSRESQDGEFMDLTAKRETSEELGIPVHAIRILGRLTPLYIPHSGFCVYPFVGHISHRRWRDSSGHPEWHADAGEVAEVFAAPVDGLLQPAMVHTEIHVRDGQPFQVPVYQFGEHKVWGATAMILAELAAVISTGPSADQAAEPER